MRERTPREQLRAWAEDGAWRVWQALGTRKPRRHRVDTLHTSSEDYGAKTWRIEFNGFSCSLILYEKRRGWKDEYETARLKLKRD